MPNASQILSSVTTVGILFWFCLLYTSNESRELKNAEQLEERLLLTEEIQEELEQKDQLIVEPVSYTHLDVYKRQLVIWPTILLLIMCVSHVYEFIPDGRTLLLIVYLASICLLYTSRCV